MMARVEINRDLMGRVEINRDLMERVEQPATQTTMDGEEMEDHQDMVDDVVGLEQTEMVEQPDEEDGGIEATVFREDRSPTASAEPVVYHSRVLADSDSDEEKYSETHWNRR